VCKGERIILKWISDVPCWKRRTILCVASGSPNFWSQKLMQYLKEFNGDPPWGRSLLKRRPVVSSGARIPAPACGRRHARAAQVRVADVSGNADCCLQQGLVRCSVCAICLTYPLSQGQDGRRVDLRNCVRLSAVTWPLYGWRQQQLRIAHFAK
jgi:hypothetical protein